MSIAAVVTVVFFLVHLSPGNVLYAIVGDRVADPEVLAAVSARLGLDRPLHEQYIRWLVSFFQGDLGTSLVTRRPISADLWPALPRTFELAAASMLLALLLGIPLGVATALRRGRAFDVIVSSVTLVGLSVPVFITGSLLMYLFAYLWNWFPPFGYVPLQQNVGAWLRHLTLPAVSLTAMLVPIIARMTRSSLLEVLQEDYVRTARAKGLSEGRVIYRHALRTALVPIVTVVGIELASLLGGVVVTETVFGWPGLGTYLLQGLRSRDFPVVQATVLVIALIFVLMNLVVDMLYAWLDPRIRYR